MESVFYKRLAKLIEVPYFTKCPYELEYLVGYKGSNGALLVFSDSDFIFYTDQRYYLEYKDRLGQEYLKIINGSFNHSDFFSLLLEEILKREKRALTLDWTKINHQDFQLMDKALSQNNISLYNIKEPLSQVRMLKTPEEIQSIKKAQEIVDKALFSVIGLLKEGVKAQDISNELRYLMYKQGADGTAFDNIVLFGDDTALIHGKANERSLKYGDIVLIDTGAVFNGYCSDITRTFVFGKADDVFKKRYQALLSVQKAVISEVKDGIKAGSLDKKARELLKIEDLEQYFTHSLGHGIGLEVHEEPRITKNNDQVLERNMVFSIEPGIYIEKEYGIRIEDLVYINPNGKGEVLSQIPKELLEIY